MVLWSFYKYQRNGLLFCLLTLVLYVLVSIVEMRFGFTTVHGPNNLTTSFIVRKHFCNESAHSGLPNDDVIDKMDIDTLYKTFLSYTTTRQINCCNIGRAGSKSSFGKNICLDYFKNVRNACLVYSFGSQFNFEFENSIWENYKCEIHTFDPSLSPKGKEMPEGVNFHLTGISDSDSIVPASKGLKDFPNWTMKTLSSIRKSLNHEKRNVDFLKIDVEGWEWKVIPDVIRSRDFKYVKQLCLEIHFGYKFENVWNGDRLVTYQHVNSYWGDTIIQNQLKSLRYLYEQGFRIFKSDPIKGWGEYYLKKSQKKIITLMEISLVNINN